MKFNLFIFIFASLFNIIFMIYNVKINTDLKKNYKFLIDNQIVCTKFLSCWEINRVEWKRKQSEAVLLAELANRSM